jgi:hypothetical protein
VRRTRKRVMTWTDVLVAVVFAVVVMALVNP